MIIYHYDNAGNLTVPESVVDTVELPSCSTSVPPIYNDGTAILNAKWDGKSWSGKPNAVPDLDQNLTLKTQVSELAYQQMITQKTITDLQKQNAQMAYKLMTAQGGATA